MIWYFIVYFLKTTITGIFLPTATTVLLTLLGNEAKDIIICNKQTMLWTYMSQNYDKGGCHMRFLGVFFGLWDMLRCGAL